MIVLDTLLLLGVAAIITSLSSFYGQSGGNPEGGSEGARRAELARPQPG